MKPSASLQRIKRSTYYIGVVAFFAMIGGLIWLIYYATLQIEYMWRWSIIPISFVYQQEEEIQTNIEGVVESITKQGEEAIIQVKGDDGTTESYRVPTEDIHVSEGDSTYPGDTLATYKRWRPGLLLQGLWITIKVSIFGIIFGIVIGLIGGIARVSSNPAFKWSAITYVEFIRGSPLLVQILIWHFVLGTLVNQILDKQGLITIPPLWFGIAALAFFAGAYVTEIVRAGIQSIHRGQIEASRSLGMTYGQCMHYIILPQAIGRILPPLAGQFISLIKDSSLLGMIAIRELLKATREVITTRLQPFELYFTCAALYLVVTFTLSMFVQYLERRTATE
jgi:polar amino acid transport system permease protein